MKGMRDYARVPYPVIHETVVPDLISCEQCAKKLVCPERTTVLVKTDHRRKPMATALLLGALVGVILLWQKA